MIPVSNSVDVHGAKAQFEAWVDGSKNSGHISGPNAYSIKKAFDKAVKTSQDQDDAKSIFATELARVKLVKGASQSMIVGAARKAIDAHPGAPAKSPMSTKNHDAVSFASMYEAAQVAGDVAGQKHLLKEIHRQTKVAAKDGFMIGNTLISISPAAVKAMQNGTTIIHRPETVKSKGDVEITLVSVQDGDTIDVAHELVQQGLNPCVLNMANAHKPGGGWKNGARAQEESLFRRSNYYIALDPEENPHLQAQFKGKAKYYVPELGVIYTPGVTVFRDNVSKGFAFVEPFNLDMIAAAAYDLKHEKPQNYEENSKEKIRAVLRVSAGTGHDAVVLGALGCGAFDNDPTKVAGLFEQVLGEGEFKGLFKQIVFAIIDDHNSQGNLGVFQKSALNGMIIEK